MLGAVYLISATIALMVGAVSWGYALRHRKISKRNRQLSALERFDSERPNLPGLLRSARGLATSMPGAATVSPIDPNERAVWVRYVLEELSHGWNEVFSEARPAAFRLSLGGERAVMVHATTPKTLLLREGAATMLGELFDDESPEELSRCSPEFAAKVEAERALRDALFRVRVQRILEGETVQVAGVVAETGDALRLDDAKPGTLLANIHESELVRRPKVVVDAILGVVGFCLIGSGIVLLRFWTKS